MENIKIGKVNIDLTHYAGTDLYSEGEIEDKLLKVSEEHAPSEFRKIIEENDDWSHLYHLSKERQNIVSWLPICKNDKVLDIGAGMGAITGELCKLAGEVRCVDLSLKRSKVNANRNKEYDNLSISVGNFTDIEPTLGEDYDWIMLIGVFEYAISYINSATPFEDFLKIMMKHLKPNGRIVIAIENRLGLKYFAGCKEDHTCGFFDGITNYVNGGQVRTFSKNGLCKIFDAVNITNYHFYYPYPDYKLPNTIFSDKRLPVAGELKDNIRNFDQDRLLLFDETKAYDSFIEDGTFPMFSNSFEVIIGPDVNVDYAKYSMERDDAVCVFTRIVSENGIKKVIKEKVYESGNAHIADMYKAYDELSQRYRGAIEGDWHPEGSNTKLSINKILDYDSDKGRITFEYVSGKTLEELLDECVLKNDKEGFIKLFEKFKAFALYNEDYQVVDDDFIFSNIIVKDDVWTVIDYEWVRFVKGNGEEVIERAINNYLITNNFRTKIKDWIDTKNDYNEELFRERVLKENVALPTIRHNIGKGVFNLDYMTDRIASLNMKVQVYEDFGDGFKEENSYYLVNIKKQGPNMVLNVPIKDGVKNLRIDPGDKPVRFYVNQIKINDTDVTKESLGIMKNGCIDIRSCIQKGNVFTFKTNDPHLKISVKGLSAKAGDVLSIDCRAEYIY